MHTLFLLTYFYCFILILLLNFLQLQTIQTAVSCSVDNRSAAKAQYWLKVPCVCVESTPSSSELDALTEKLRTVDSPGPRLDKSNVRIWFQNRRREHRQQLTSSSTSSSSAAAASKLAGDVSTGCDWSVSSLGSLTWPTTTDNVLEAVTRLARYCITPTDTIDCTLFNYSSYTVLWRLGDYISTTIPVLLHLYAGTYFGFSNFISFQSFN